MKACLFLVEVLFVCVIVVVVVLLTAATNDGEGYNDKVEEKGPGTGA